MSYIHSIAFKNLMSEYSFLKETSGYVSFRVALSLGTVRNKLTGKIIIMIINKSFI